jgi:Domain of unknown function (DUF4476)
MNRFALCLLFLMSVFTASSQKVYFVYMQAEADQPFFVKMNERIYSSSASGYLILSKLRDSIYNFSIGFPQNKLPEQNFSVAINKKDHGYLLKNFGEKGWGLFDLQSSAVQMSVAPVSKIDATEKSGEQNTSAFTDILSKAADDPSLKEKPIQAKMEEKKTEVIPQEVIKKEEVKPTVIEEPALKKEEPRVETKEQPVVKNEETHVDIKKPSSEKKEEIKTNLVESYKPTMVTKKSESSNVEGFDLVFIDDYGNGVKDTIRLLIPDTKPAIDEIKQEPKEEKKFLDILPDTSNKVKEIVSEIKKDSLSETKAAMNEAIIKPAVKNNCKEIASETDFYKLRKKMAAETIDDNMITEARKYFKSKCFTTDQLKNLSTLFLNDAGKYKFFDAAYTYVSDVDHFSILQSELKDEYYINRFKAMLRN